MSEAKMSIADAMRSVMTQIREQTAENNKKWELYSEVQRLRAALEDIRYQVQQSDHPAGLGILATINQALSTTTEPTRAERVREPVAWFAQQMEAKLRENDHKGGWQNCSWDWLVERIYRETKELWIEVGRVDIEPKRIIREAADVANFAMMIADIARRINDNPELMKGEETE